jgi:hypothetical protein
VNLGGANVGLVSKIRASEGRKGETGETEVEGEGDIHHSIDGELVLLTNKHNAEAVDAFVVVS